MKSTLLSDLSLSKCRWEFRSNTLVLNLVDVCATPRVCNSFEIFGHGVDIVAGFRRGPNVGFRPIVGCRPIGAIYSIDVVVCAIDSKVDCIDRQFVDKLVPSCVSGNVDAIAKIRQEIDERLE